MIAVCVHYFLFPLILLLLQNHASVAQQRKFEESSGYISDHNDCITVSDWLFNLSELHKKKKHRRGNFLYFWIVGIINLIYFRQARCRLRVVYYRARSGCAMEYLSMRMQSFWSTQLASFSSRFIAFRITFLPLTSGG